jgi:uncharacterized protein
MPDNRIVFAFDKQTARSRDADGRMRVKNCILSTAEINPYRGSEIPGHDTLGLKPNHVYDLYRHPDEMAKAAPTFEGVPLMIKHVGQTAEEPRKEYQAGAIHSVKFDGKHLRGDLLVSDGKAIDLIESGAMTDLSCGYRYTPDMQAGEVGGRHHDGVMRNLAGNHVALVDDGRASGAHVADSALFDPQGPNPTMQGVDEMAGENDLPAGGPPGSPAGEEHEQSAMAQVGQALKHIAGLLENIHGKLGGNEGEAAPPPGDTAGADEGAGSASEIEPAVRTEGESERAEDDSDEDDDGEGEGAMDEEGEYPVPAQSKQEGDTARGEPTPHGAMDANSIRKHTAAAVDAAVKRERVRAQNVERAKRDVRGVLGEVYGMDSARAIYREALAAVGQDVAAIPKGMERVAWNTHVNAAARTAGARPRSEMAMDSAGVEKTQAGILASLSKIRNLG